MRLYLALRESAHQRLFAHVPWLRAHLVDAVEAYARGITVDTARLEEAVGTIDPSDPESLQRALTGGLFEPEDTPEQTQALARLETALALVEGWVDEVVDAAATTQAAGAPPRCARRCAGAGRPAARPSRPSPRWSGSSCGRAGCARRLRCGGAVLAERGQDGRDAVWAPPRPAAGRRRPRRPGRLRQRRRAPPPLDLSGLDDTQAPPEPDQP